MLTTIATGMVMCVTFVFPNGQTDTQCWRSYAATHSECQREADTAARQAMATGIYRSARGYCR